MRHEVIMGNICSSNNNNKVAGRPPRDLSGLIEDVVSHQTGEQPSLWGDLFIQFLKHRGQTDLEYSLAFCVKANRVSVLQDQADTTQSSKVREGLLQERISLLKEIFDSHFKLESAKPVALRNQVLREELVELLAIVGQKSTEEEVAVIIEAVSSALSDSLVWKSLDSAYKTFVANKPSPSVSQVLLSIL